MQLIKTGFNMEKLIEDVTGGTLDFVLTKPEEAQVLVSVNQVRGVEHRRCGRRRGHHRCGPLLPGRFDGVAADGGIRADAARWPITIYPGWLKSALTFLVPVAFAVTVPSQALVGRMTAELLSGSLALAAVMLVG